MKKFIPFLIFIGGCVLSPEPGGPAYLGESAHAYGQVGVLDTVTDTRGYSGFRLVGDPGDYFFVYLKANPTTHPRTYEALTNNPRGRKLYDYGGRCLSFPQDGKDTVTIGGGTVVVTVPVESCVPFLRDEGMRLLLSG